MRQRHADEAEATAPEATVPSAAADEASAATAGDGAEVSEAAPALDDPSLYLNRELSLLEFQRRVLEEAMEADKPLLERVSFIAILGSNIDELFMVRVAALRQQVAAGSTKRSLDGASAAQQLKLIRETVIALTEQAYACWHHQLVPALAAEGIHIVDYGSLAADEKAALKHYFTRMLYPVLTPQGVDAGRPFPRISGLSVSLVALVKDSRGDVKLARVKVPDSVPQLLPVPSAKKAAAGQRFIWIEEVIKANLGDLFPGLEIVEAHPIRVTRDADVAIKEIESDDLLETIEEEIWKRRFRGAVRLQVAESIPDHMVSLIASHLEISSDDIYRFQITDGAQEALAAGRPRSPRPQVQTACARGAEALAAAAEAGPVLGDPRRRRAPAPPV